MQKLSNLKKEILLTIAETSNFAMVRKKFPRVSDSFIKGVLIESSEFFNVEKEMAAASDVKVDTPLTIYVDGASKGNPGVSAAGIAILDENGRNVSQIKKYLGVMTNNKAEYNALIIGLKEALKINDKKITIFMDSELVVKQVKGEYKIKSDGLRMLYSKAMNLLNKFDGYVINHIMRSKNKLADSLANEAIKEHISSE